mmetsp:Transcript_17357/g.24882  ORF Transcript_17357/g.24882 Transcript_17357/m.24882 type:complete len:171 (+) Transcript_17357:1102-1614(+)
MSIDQHKKRNSLPGFTQSEWIRKLRGRGKWGARKLSIVFACDVGLAICIRGSLSPSKRILCSRNKRNREARFQEAQFSSEFYVNSHMAARPRIRSSQTRRYLFRISFCLISMQSWGPGATGKDVLASNYLKVAQVDSDGDHIQENLEYSPDIGRVDETLMYVVLIKGRKK